MTSRETFLNVTDQVVAAPGPGHYDPAKPQDTVKVSCLPLATFYQSARMTNVILVTVYAYHSILIIFIVTKFLHLKLFFILLV